MKKLVIIRGLPGSGKTTLAKSLKPQWHFEADMYFECGDGKYRFDQTKIKDAHDWCKRLCALSLRHPKPGVTVGI